PRFQACARLPEPPASPGRKPAEAGNNLAQEFEALVSKIDLLERQPGDVAAGSRQTRDEVATDRVSRHGKNDRDERCCLLCRNDGRGSRGDDNIDVEPNELGRKFGKALAASLRIPGFDRNIATFDPTEFAQPLHKSGDSLTLSRGRIRAQVSDGRQPPR